MDDFSLTEIRRFSLTFWHFYAMTLYLRHIWHFQFIMKQSIYPFKNYIQNQVCFQSTRTSQDPPRISKVGCVCLMVVQSEFPMAQYRYENHHKRRTQSVREMSPLSYSNSSLIHDSFENSRFCAQAQNSLQSFYGINND